MKKLLTILIIFLTFSSLKSQPVPYNPEWITVTKDCLIFKLPVNFNIVMPHAIPEKKSSQWQDLKARIPYLIPIATAMFIFRDDLQEWSIKNDKLAHLFLSYGIAKICGWRFAAGFMIAIELTQIDVFGISGRYGDTAADLFMDGCGILFTLKF